MSKHSGEKRGPMSVSWKAAALLVSAMALGLGSYLFLESQWFQSNVESETLRFLYLSWWMGGAFVLSAVLAWLYLERSIQPFPEKFTRARELPDRSEEFRRYALWLVQLRWLAALLSGVLSFLAAAVLGLLEETLLLPLGVLVVLLLSSNVAFLFASKRSANPYRIIVLQTVSDLLLLTLLLHFSGGIENPLYAIYVFHVVIAAMLLTGRGSYLITSIACVLLSFVAFVEYFEILPHYAVHLTPHEHGAHAEEAASVVHPAHDVAFVLGRLLPFLGILYCLTYLTRIVVSHLHRREGQLLLSLKEREVVEAQLVQAGKMAAVGELAGNFAHEVNNPVAVISGKAKLLLDKYRDTKLPPDVTEDMRKIDLHASRIGRITSGLLAFSRPSLGKKESLDLNEVINSTLELVDSPLRAAGIRLVCHLGDALPRVLGNQNELQQVFFNIFANAIDVMPDGGVLDVTTRRGASEGTTGKKVPIVEVAVTDTGPGMDDTVRDRIFEPFFTTKKKGRGTGLGLSISLGLIRSHDGRIDVRTSPAKGTTVVVALPAREEILQPLERQSHGGVQGADPR